MTKIKFFLLISTLAYLLFGSNLAIAQIIVDFSHERGFYTESFDLEINVSGYQVSVKYTLDGSEPTEINGINPANVNSFTIAGIDRTTVVRVYAYNIEEKISRTHTYIFVDDVFSQNNNSVINELTYPVEWGYGSNYIGVINCRTQAADYDMTIDNCITNVPDYQQKLIDGLMEIPTIAISLDKYQVFGPDSGIYVFPVEKSDACYTLPNNVHSWERKASVEIFNDVQDGDTLELQVNAGLEMSGASTRYLDFYKHSFKLKFRSEYGAGKLKYPLYGDEASDRFESIQLRMVGQSSPHDFRSERRREPQFHKDHWTKQLQKKLSGYGTSPTSKFFHLFINGIYWGMYDVTERPDAHFMADYYGGLPEDYDVIKVKEVKDGTDTVYNKMFELGHAMYDTVQINTFTTRPVPNENRANHFYNEVKNVLDIDNFLDYSLLNLLLVNTDYIENNWWVARNAQKNEKFQFFVWDAEIILNYAGINRTIYTNGDSGVKFKYHPIDLNQRLLDVPAYKIKFADNIQCHCIEDDGVLKTENLIASYKETEQKIHNATLLEFARWGDARKLESDFEQICYDAVEETLQKYSADHFPYLLEYMLSYYGNPFTHAIFPAYYRLSTSGVPTEIFNFKAVQFSKLGGEVANGYQLTLTNLNTTYNAAGQIVPLGDIYYTTDGSDPRNVDGSIASTAIKYTNPIIIDEYKMIKARVFTETFSYRDPSTKTIDNFWTAMCPRDFFPANYYDDLIINEIHYNPADIGTISGSNLEFLEIKNRGNNELNISNTILNNGVHYQFPMNTKVPGNGFILLASDSTAVCNNYNCAVDGQYEGKLANSGEKITYARPDGAEIDEVKYDDGAPWNDRPDGGGTSLSLYLDEVDRDNNHLAESWGSSAGGSTPKVENVFCLPMTLNLTAFDLTCYNGTDGIVDLSITGGSAPYDIKWSTNSTSGFISNLASGVYEVEVLDDQNCLETQSIAVVNPDRAYINLQVTHATTANSADGYATINPSNLPYGYSVVWSDGSTGNTNSNLSIANNYWVKVTDSRNNTCTITESFAVEVASPCSIPSNFSATSTSEENAIISWSGNTDNTGYEVAYKALADSAWTTVTTLLPNLILNNLRTCTTYEYIVKGNCNTINSNSSTVKSFTTTGCTDFCSAGEVIGNTINITSFSSFILWDIVPNATYRLKYRKNGVNAWKEYETSINFAILFGLDKCSNYEWYIETVCPSGAISSTSVNNFTTLDCLKIINGEDGKKEESTNILNFNIYPNPAQNFIKIDSKNIESEIESQILIYDFSGRLVKNGGTIVTHATISIEDLKPGLYVVQIVSATQNLQYRFRKNN